MLSPLFVTDDGLDFPWKQSSENHPRWNKSRRCVFVKLMEIGIGRTVFPTPGHLRPLWHDFLALCLLFPLYLDHGIVRSGTARLPLDTVYKDRLSTRILLSVFVPLESRTPISMVHSDSGSNAASSLLDDDENDDGRSIADIDTTVLSRHVFAYLSPVLTDH